MRKIFIVGVLGTLYLSIVSLSFDKFSENELVTPIPNLPVVPYDYDLNFPEHAINGGYANIDTTIANEMITKHGAALGRVLFYDKQLSIKNTISCSSCHQQQFAFADTARYSVGLDGHLTTRNSPTIADLSWASGSIFFEGAILFWDCRSSSLEDAVLQPIQNAHELGKDLPYMVNKLSAINYYPPLFEKAFGDNEVTVERVSSALSQFIRSMSSFDSRYDKAKIGKITFNSSEANGESLFVTNCTKGCHNVHSFSTPFPRNNGLELNSTDLGLGGWDGQAHNIGKFKSQTLRNVEITPPYMHDGRFETLEEVIDFYSDDIQLHINSDFRHLQNPNFTGFHFTASQKEDLLAFFKTLTTVDLLVNPKWSDPFVELSSNNQIEFENNIKVYPNPVEDKLSIKMKSLSAKKADLNLFDLSGNLVWKKQMDRNDATFEIKNLQTGVYILKIEIDGQSRTKKLFIR